MICSPKYIQDHPDNLQSPRLCHNLEPFTCSPPQSTHHGNLQPGEHECASVRYSETCHPTDSVWTLLGARGGQCTSAVVVMLVDMLTAIVSHIFRWWWMVSIYCIQPAYASLPNWHAPGWMILPPSHQTSSTMSLRMEDAIMHTKLAVREPWTMRPNLLTRHARLSIAQRRGRISSSLPWPRSLTFTM